jgi:tetratricopeptide (TPR) repeat protein
MKVFLSCVTREFGSYRQRLAAQLAALPRHTFEVKVQEDFQQGGFTLLDQIGAYIRECDLVLHLVGDSSGARPSPEHVRGMFARLGQGTPEPLPELSYTQWEYELALRFDKRMLCYVAALEAERDWGPKIQQAEVEVRMQVAHRERMGREGKDYRRFQGRHDLVRKVFLDLSLSPTDKVGNLPSGSIGRLFKGRDEFLLKLRETLDEARQRGGVRANTSGVPAAVVHGLGGVGKARAALEFAHRYADEYTAMLFVAADSPGSLEANLAQLCGAAVLDLGEKEERATTRQVAAVLRWLNRNHAWILILDNVDSDEAVVTVRRLLASLTGTGEVVITSRFSRWSPEVETLELDPLNEVSSTAYLLESTVHLRRNEPEDKKCAKELTFELGQLALALEQAAAYINAQGISFRDYLERWRRHRDRLLSYHDELATHTSRSVAVTWLTSFEQLSENGRRLLRTLCWLAPEPIPRSLLQAGGGPFGAMASPGLPTIEREGLILDAEAALGDLWKYSLARSSPDKLTFSVHPLVQDVTRRTLPETERQPTLEAALSWVKAAFEGDSADVRNWPVMEPLASHGLAAANFADRQGDTLPAAWFLNTLAHFFHAKAQWAAAEPLARRAIAIYEKNWDADHAYLASSLINLSALLRVTNRLKEGEPLLRRALTILEKSWGPDHGEVAICLNNLALLLLDTNRTNEAEPLQRRALAIDEKNLGPDHPNIALRLNNLAQLLRTMDRPDQAEPLLRRALAIAEKSLGPDHPNIAPALNNLATLLHNANRLDEAEPLLRRALAITEKSLGPEHPDLAISLNNLAQLLQDRKRLDQAETLMRRALAISEKSFGPDHPSVALRLSNLALLLQDANRLGEAEPLMRRNLAIVIHFGRVNGYPHPRLRSSRDSYVSLLKEMRVPKGEISAKLRAMEAEDVL